MREYLVAHPYLSFIGFCILCLFILAIIEDLCNTYIAHKNKKEGNNKGE